MVSEKEVRLYTILKGFDVGYDECPYAKGSFRQNIGEMINKLEDEGSEVLNRTPDPEKTMYEVPKQVADYNARTDEALANAVQEIRQRDEKEIIF